MERQDRERQKEQERSFRERQQEEERLQREHKREQERQEKFLQKESIRVCKIVLPITLICYVKIIYAYVIRYLFL